ncbi:MAG: AmmeMemoRadiSam system protein B [Caldiserica bacterium]|nr:AmmeMemoRadiSam system protein B [Caldisericota bacterium]
MREEKVRKPHVAGTFYPAHPETLRESIEGFLARVKLPSLKGEIVGGVCPHAGYVYSGQAQAYVYKALRDRDFTTAVLLLPLILLTTQGLQYIRRAITALPWVRLKSTANWPKAFSVTRISSLFPRRICASIPWKFSSPFSR